MICQRPDCNNELNTGNKYCSPKCAAMDRKRIKTEQESDTGLQVIQMPSSLKAKLTEQLGDEAEIVFNEVAMVLQETTGKIPMPIAGTTYGDWCLSYGLDGGETQDLRPGTALDFDIIERMLRSGPVIFAMEMKRAQIVRVFGEGRFKVVSPDEELAEVAMASLKLIMEKMADDLTYAAFAYGSAFMEEVWEWRTKYELGISEEQDNAKFLVPELPNNVKPDTVDHIKRTESGRKFDGFVQKPNKYGDAEVTVSASQALVVPLFEHFRNLWGRSFLHVLYPIWLWYEIILRAMARYMERMAIPVTVAKAPSRGLVETEGSTTPVKAMDMALALAGSAAKSNAIAIPSDRDESGNPLWELDYLTAQERAQPFISVLEFLGQEMLRAGLSADRSLTQQSGGVGSQNIGEVHARASALTSEMILGQIIHYLNLYFMPGFSLYNRGQNGPPIWLRTQAVDLTERDLIMKLLNIAGNSPASQEVLVAIDWKSIAETSNIPLLSDDEAEELKKKLNEESLAKLKQQNELMATLKKAEAGKMNGGDNQPPGNDKKDDNSDNKNVADEKKLQEIVDAVADGRIRVPLMLAIEEADLLHDAGLIDDEVYQLFNPFHDKGGKFAPRRGGGGGSAQTKAVRQSAVGKAKKKPGSIVKTTGKVLGLGGLGLVGLMVVGAAFAGEPEPIIASEEEQEKVLDELRYDNEQQRQDVEAILANRPTFETSGQAVDYITSQLDEMGLQLDDNITLEIGMPGASGAIAAGLYDSDTNTFYMSPELAAQLKIGDPRAMHTAVHELLHNRQEVQRELGPGEMWAATEKGIGAESGAIVDMNWDNVVSRYAMDKTPETIDYINWSRQFEGENDLAAMMALSKIYGTPVNHTTSTMASMALTGVDERTGLRSVQDFNSSTGYRTGVGYGPETMYVAWLAVQNQQKTGEPIQSFIYRMQDNGFDMPYTRTEVAKIFPESKTIAEMGGTTDGYQHKMFNYSDLMKEYGGPTTFNDQQKYSDTVLRDILEEAAK